MTKLMLEEKLEKTKKEIEEVSKVYQNKIKELKNKKRELKKEISWQKDLLLYETFTEWGGWKNLETIAKKLNYSVNTVKLKLPIIRNKIATEMALKNQDD
jgi:hypothetical protein